MKGKRNRMSGKVLGLLTIAFCFSPLGVTMAGEAEGTGNLAENPGFEEADPKDASLPNVWSPEDWSTSGGKSTFIWDEKVVHSGKRSVFIETPPGSVGVWVEWSKSPAHFKPGKSYQMTAWMKAEDAGNGSGIIFDGFDVSGKRPVANGAGTHDWKKLTISGARLNKSKKHIGISFVCRGGKAWFDDVEIVEVIEGRKEAPKEAPKNKVSGPAPVTKLKRDVNIVENPSGETVESGKPVGWNCIFSGRGDYEWGSSSESYKGKKSIFLSTKSQEKGYIDCALIAGKSNLVKGKDSACAFPSTKYYFSFYLKGDIPEVDIGIMGWSSEEGFSKDAQEIIPTLRRIKPTPEWKRYEGTFATYPVNAKYGLDYQGKYTKKLAFYLKVQRSGKGSTKLGTIFIDDLYVSTKQQADSRLLDSRMAPPRVVLHKIPPDSFAYFSADYYTGVSYLSPDMPAMLHFCQVSTLAKTIGDPEAKLIFEVPEEIKILSGRGMASKEEEKVLRDNKPYRRYRMRFHRSAYQTIYTTVLFASTTLKPGQEVKSYYWAEWRNGRQKEIELPIKIIHIEKVQPPKRLVMELNMSALVLEQWPDYQDLINLGFNTLTIGGTYDLWGASWGIRCINKSLEKFAGKGLTIGGWMGDYPEFASIVSGKAPAKYREVGTLYHPKKHFTEWDVEDAKAMTMSGNRLKVPCPSYRGQFFQKLVDYGKGWIDKGVFYIHIDPEYYSHQGASICFCPRCREKFKAFLKEKYPQLKYIDPTEFEKDAEKYSQLHQAWLDFKTEMYAGMATDYRKELEAYMKQKGIKEKLSLIVYLGGQGLGLTSAEERRKSKSYTDSLHDAQKWAEPCDYIELSCYLGYDENYDLIRMADNVKGLPQLIGDKAKVLGCMSCGYIYYIYAKCNITEDRMMKYQLLEVLASGVKGLFFWGYTALDALDMKYIAEVVKMVKPVEDIIVDGEPIKEGEIRDLNKNTFVKGIKSEKGTIILVSEYSQIPKEANIEYKVKGRSHVIDLDTGKAIAELTPGKPLFRVKLDKERARLFYVGGKREDF